MYASPASLVGKHCVVTGGSRGIGAAIAALFAARGAHCTLVGRDADALSAAVNRLPPPSDQAPPHRFHQARPMDVSSADAWAALVSELKGDKTDILVNAAGVSQNSALHRTSTDDARGILDTNLLGTALGCRAFIRQMMKQKEGCIINVSSLLAVKGGMGASVYAASKAGVIGLTRSLACEVGRFGIRANVLVPGYIETDMTKGLRKDGSISAQIPLGRLGRVEEVADAALFLATNPYAHNCVLNIDGGLSGV